MKYGWWIVGALLAIEIVRRLALTADCFVTLQTNPLSRFNPAGQNLSECVWQHALFPFGIFR
jgi:hypothetical protein